MCLRAQDVARSTVLSQVCSTEGSTQLACDVDAFAKWVQHDSICVESDELAPDDMAALLQV
jgi:hypothetical protein